VAEIPVSMLSLSITGKRVGSTVVILASEGPVPRRNMKDRDKTVLQELLNINSGFPMAVIPSGSVEENLQWFKRIETKNTTTLNLAQSQITSKLSIKKIQILGIDEELIATSNDNFKMEGIDMFTDELEVIQLERCDVKLGVNWLTTIEEVHIKGSDKWIQINEETKGVRLHFNDKVADIQLCERMLGHNSWSVKGQMTRAEKVVVLH
jgi:hypothetical protein